MLILFLAGFIAGVDNAVAGGGSIIVYPLLLSLGLAPIMANATTTATVWPGAISSAIGYRKHLKPIPRYYFLLLIPCAIGGLAGAILLGHTTNSTFEKIVPWFIAAATILLALQPALHRWLETRAGKKFAKSNHELILIGVGALLLITSIYGGYFGAGFGIVMLAFLGLTKLRNIHQMNALKITAGVTVNAMAMSYFIHKGLIVWSTLPLLLMGSISGGWLGATYSAELPEKQIRRIVVVVGAIITAYLFYKQYA